MRKFQVLVGVGFLLTVAVGCGVEQEAMTRNEVEPQPTNTPTETAETYEINITHVAVAGETAEISYQTNIPVPFEAMASVSLTGQAGEDVYIGNDSRIAVTDQTGTVRVSMRQDARLLPSGTYSAEISFYPRWGATQSPESTRRISEPVHGTRVLEFSGSAETADEATFRSEAQRWVMLNVAAGHRWDLGTFEQRLGRSEEIDVENRTPVIAGYYFPRADMTIFVSVPLDEVVVWRIGRETRL